MPQNDGKIQLGNLTNSIDWREASKHIRAPRGRVVVEMLPNAEKAYGFLLPETVAANLRPDVGVVVAAPTQPIEVRKRSLPYPEVGAMVAVRPYDGNWIEGAECGDYVPQGQLRCYGVFIEHDEPVRCDWFDSIVLEIAMEGYRPYGDKILFRLDAANKSEGGILLLDQARSGMATVMATGPLVWDVKPNDRVCVNLQALEQTGLKLDICDTDDKDLAVGTELCINYIQAKTA